MPEPEALEDNSGRAADQGKSFNYEFVRIIDFKVYNKAE